MRLLHVMAEMDPEKGGVGQAVRTLMKGLSDAGVPNEAVSLDTADAAFITGSNLTIHALGPGKGPWCYSSGLAPWLIKNLSGFDAVIVHGLWLYHGYAVRKAIEILKKEQTSGTAQKTPVLFVMPHGMLDPYFQKAEGRKLKALRNILYWKLIEGKLINQSDGGLYFTSQEEKKLAGKSFTPYHPKHEAVVGLGIEELPPYNPTMKKAFLERCPGVNNSSYILYIGRIDEKKGVDLLVEAYKRWVEKAGSVETRLPELVIAGPGIESTYGLQLKQLATAYKSTIFFPGMLHSDAKWGAFYGCEVCILPSHQENFGIAVVESLACGKPVLISNKVNIWQEIENAGAGLVEDDTADGTLKLLEGWSKLTKADKKEMEVKALDCFKDKFSIAPVAVRIKNDVTGKLAQFNNA